MSLKDEIEKMQETLLPQIPEQIRALFRETTQRWLDAGIAQRSLRTGDKAPDFSLPNAVGAPIDSRDLLKNGPLVVSFYRGSWCPYCDLELRALQVALSSIQSLGAQLVGISPQTVEKTAATRKDRQLRFEVLSDKGNQVARSFGLVFKLDKELQEIYPQLGIRLSDSNGDSSWELPIPATYVIAPDGTIVYSYVNADYTQRAELEQIIAVLRGISAAGND